MHAVALCSRRCWPLINNVSSVLVVRLNKRVYLTIDSCKLVTYFRGYPNCQLCLNWKLTTWNKDDQVIQTCQIAFVIGSVFTENWFCCCFKHVGIVLPLTHVYYNDQFIWHLTTSRADNQVIKLFKNNHGQYNVLRPKNNKIQIKNNRQQNQ